MILLLLKEESGEESVEKDNNEVRPVEETETVADTSEVQVEVAVQNDSTGGTE